MRTVIQHATAITCVGASPQIFNDHSIVIDDGVITKFGPDRDVAINDKCEVINASNHLVTPGWINTHHHLLQSATRCLIVAQDKPLFEWLVTLYPFWRHIDYEVVKAAASVSIAELLLSGCTTTSDHFYMFPPQTDTRIEAVLDAARELGIRIHAGRGSMDLGKSRGGLPPDECVESTDRVLADSARVIERFHEPDDLALVKIDLAPCSPFNVTPELFLETARIARDHGLLLHTHAAETSQEQEYCLKRYGLTPIRYLEKHDWLGKDVYLAHCVHLGEEDLDRINDTGTSIAHCPNSNMRLGSGIAAVRRWLDRGLSIGIGVDGSSSNDGGSFLSEARQTILLQRVLGGANAMSAADAFRLATVGGAGCLSRPRLGRLANGFAADIAMFRKDDLWLSGGIVHDPIAAMFLCQPKGADRVLVNGKTVVQDGNLVSADPRKLAESLNHAARRVVDAKRANDP